MANILLEKNTIKEISHWIYKHTHKGWIFRIYKILLEYINRMYDQNVCIAPKINNKKCTFRSQF